jgi:predicted branched-subunit amino acid permease
MHSAAFRTGMREALGVQAGVLAASYIGFGALAYSSGVSIWVVMASTITIWALPGQLALIEMWQIGAPVIAVVLAVMLTNARFLPMTVTLFPLLHSRSHARWTYYLAAQCVAMSIWVLCMRRCPEMPAEERLPFFAGLSAGLIAVSVGAGALGFLVADSIPAIMQIGLVFLAPVYFFVFLIVEVRSRLAAIAIACGGLAGPLFYMLTPQWSLLAAGFAGGTVAFAIHKFMGRVDA